MSSPASREWTAARPKRLMGKKNSRPDQSCQVFDANSGFPYSAITTMLVMRTPLPMTARGIALRKSTHFFQNFKSDR